MTTAKVDAKWYRAAEVILGLDERLQQVGLKIIGRQVGSGGSANVHKAVVETERESLPARTPVAVKEYLPTILSIPGQLDRIRQEAQVGERIRHPNVIRTLGLLEPVTDDPASGYVLLLEWIDGKTLEQWHADVGKPIPWEAMRALCLEMLDGVEALHKEHVLHRDLKPDNVMVRADGRAVIMDVGVAELTADVEHTLHTALKDFIGSARFASPQFLLGQGFEVADDVYSLVATYYLLFTSKQVFHEVSRKPVIPIHVVQETPQVDRLAPGVPISMKLLLQAGLHKERNRRPTLQEIRDCLTRPEDAAFLTRELDRQAADSRGYQILKVSEDGAAFFADMAGDEPQLDREYVVVRRGKEKVQLASYNREAIPEQWVARAVLKHVHQNLGHFTTLGRRWEGGRPPRDPLRSALGGISEFLRDPGTPGQWLEYEKRTDAIRTGDIVLRSGR